MQTDPPNEKAGIENLEVPLGADNFDEDPGTLHVGNQCISATCGEQWSTK